jgi:type II secretory ATPase GspE/PulE/Tfp pilus assembly ATPase PilB-like protein
MSGRTGLFELFIPDAELHEMIIDNRSVRSIRDRARQKGMRVLGEDAAEKVKAGITTEAEVKRTLSFRLLQER